MFVLGALTVASLAACGGGASPTALPPAPAPASTSVALASNPADGEPPSAGAVNSAGVDNSAPPRKREIEKGGSGAPLASKAAYPPLNSKLRKQILAEFRAVKSTMVIGPRTIRDAYDACYALEHFDMTGAQVAQAYFPRDGGFTTKMITDIAASLEKSICAKLPSRS